MKLLLKNALNNWGALHASCTGVLASWSSDCRAEWVSRSPGQNEAHAHSTHSAWLSCVTLLHQHLSRTKGCVNLHLRLEGDLQFLFCRLAGGQAHFLLPLPALSWLCSQFLSQTCRDLGSHFQGYLAFQHTLGTNGALFTLPLLLFPSSSPSTAFTLLGVGLRVGQTRLSSGETQAVRKGLMFGRGNDWTDPPGRHFQVTVVHSGQFRGQPRLLLETSSSFLGDWALALLGSLLLLILIIVP